MENKGLSLLWFWTTTFFALLLRKSKFDFVDRRQRIFLLFARSSVFIFVTNLRHILNLRTFPQIQALLERNNFRHLSRGAAAFLWRLKWSENFVFLLVHFFKFSIRVVPLNGKRGFVVEICKFKIPRFSVAFASQETHITMRFAFLSTREEERERERSDRVRKLVKESASVNGEKREEYLGHRVLYRFIRVLLCSRATPCVNFELMRCVFILLSFSHIHTYTCCFLSFHFFFCRDPRHYPFSWSQWIEAGLLNKLYEQTYPVPLFSTFKLQF